MATRIEELEPFDGSPRFELKFDPSKNCLEYVGEPQSGTCGEHSFHEHLAFDPHRKTIRVR